MILQPILPTLAEEACQDRHAALVISSRYRGGSKGFMEPPYSRISLYQKKFILSGTARLLMHGRKACNL